MNVVWSQSAVADLVEIYDFIARDSPHYAQRMVDRITVRSTQLGTFPDSGSLVPEFVRHDLREVFEGPFRIIYRRTEEQVAVLTVLHGSRQLTELPDIDA